MAKSTNGGKTKATGGETKARRAPVRRASTKTAETPIAVASELATNPIEIDPEDVRRRAYEIYCGRGCTGGSAESDWLEAERQLRTSRTH